MTDFLHHVFICLVQSLYLIFPLAWIQLSLSHGKDDHARFGFHSREYAINACFPNYSLKNAHNGQFFAQVFFGPKNLNAESFGEKYFDPFKKRNWCYWSSANQNLFLAATYVLTRKHSFSTWKKKNVSRRGRLNLCNTYTFMWM